MSVKLSHVSFTRTQQVPLWTSDSQKEKESIVENICSEDTSVEDYYQIVIYTWGWENGARSRVKKLHPNRALAYVNKLFTGGWIDDDTYHLMYCSVNNLLQKNSWPGHAKWEMFPWRPVSLNRTLGYDGPLLK